MMALKALGYSMNTENEQELQEAYEWLVQCVETMDTEIVTDEIIDNMAQGRKALGLIYSGDASYVMAENEDMGYFMPETGTNLWSDAMVIPKMPRIRIWHMRLSTMLLIMTALMITPATWDIPLQTRRLWIHCPEKAEIMKASTHTFRGQIMRTMRCLFIMKTPKDHQ